jgi:cytochrome P450
MTKKAFNSFTKSKASDNSEDHGMLLRILKDDKTPATEKQFPRLVDDAKFLMIAGVDAPSQVLAITMFHILNNLSVYRKLQEELINAMPDPMQVLPLSLLERLPYLVTPFVMLCDFPTDCQTVCSD